MLFLAGLHSMQLLLLVCFLKWPCSVFTDTLRFPSVYPVFILHRMQFTHCPGYSILSFFSLIGTQFLAGLHSMQLLRLRKNLSF
jgi:hypothetical protein